MACGVGLLEQRALLLTSVARCPQPGQDSCAARGSLVWRGDRKRVNFWG